MLIDDVHSFRDGRICQVARSSDAGVALLLSLRTSRIAELWLKHDLAGDDTIWPVVQLLEDAAADHARFSIGVINVHDSRSRPAHELRLSLRRLGYQTARITTPRLWDF